MEDRLTLSYFYGKEADQYSFYKIPKLLFTDEHFKKVSVEAKVLYGLMLDRMSLSMKNQWLDDEGRAYIYYSLDDIMDALGCSNKKAISIMKELDTEDGIGLIEKKRQDDSNKILATYSEEPGLQVLNGRFGPYIAFNKKNYKIPKGTDAASLTLEQCREIIAKQDAEPTAKKPARRKAASAKKK